MNSGSRAETDEHAHAELVLEFQELVLKINFSENLFKQARIMLYALVQRDDAIALVEEFRRGAIKKCQDSEFIIPRHEPRFVDPVLLDPEIIDIKSGGG